MAIFEASSRKTSWLLGLLISLFLALDLFLLGLNFHITKQVSEDALVINLASRQSTLIQQMSTAVSQIDTNKLSTSESQILTDQFSSAYLLFNQTLNAFYYGGLVTDPEHHSVSISRVNIPKGRDILFQAQELNKAITSIGKIIAERGITSDNFSRARNVLAEVNDELLVLMSRLTVIIENSLDQKTANLRTIQIFSFCFALLNFAAIIFLFRLSYKYSRDLVSILSELFQSTNVALLVFSSDQRVLMSNSFASHFLGYSPRELKHMTRSSLILESPYGDNAKCLARDGKKVDVKITERTVTHKGNRLSVLTIMDVSGHLNKEHQDLLTGIQNRHALSMALEVKSEQVRSIGGRFACFFLDLNSFKEINECYGHESGDYVLKCFAYRLKQTLRENDLVFRFGGDEFIILVELTSDTKSIDPISKKLHAMMQKPINISNQEAIHLSFSAGVSIYPDDTTDPDELLSFADKALYRAKKDLNTDIIRHQS